jgi:hypothetical protein
LQRIALWILEIATSALGRSFSTVGFLGAATGSAAAAGAAAADSSGAGAAAAAAAAGTGVAGLAGNTLLKPPRRPLTMRAIFGGLVDLSLSPVATDDDTDKEAESASERDDGLPQLLSVRRMRAVVEGRIPAVAAGDGLASSFASLESLALTLAGRAAGSNSAAAGFNKSSSGGDSIFKSLASIVLTALVLGSST